MCCCCGVGGGCGVLGDVDIQRGERSWEQRGWEQGEEGDDEEVWWRARRNDVVASCR